MLATEADLVARLGRDLSDEESARYEALLDDVSGSVQLYTGQKFIRGDYTMRTRVKRGLVRLPQRPVHSVDAVADINGNDIGFEWDGLDRVSIGGGMTGSDFFSFSGHPISRSQVVDVTYNAGPDTVPQPIIGVVCGIALRTLGVDPTEGGVTSESIDGYSYTIGSAGGAGAYGVLRDEMRTLNSFRRVGGSMRLAQ